MSEKKIPYKIYLEESEMPREWYNVRADMKNKPAPLLNPATLQPMTAEELGTVFCEELVKQELDNDSRYIEIPEKIRDFYKMYRPAPLVRAYCLEEKLQTPAKIYYKFEGNNTSGSHKLNSAIAQAYYAKEQGLKGVTTETGAGQWGTALSMACAYLDLDCKVFMVKCSYEQKPFRRRKDALYSGELLRRLKHSGLLYRTRLHITVVVKLRQDRTHAVIAKSSRVICRRDESASKRVHLRERTYHSGVAEIICKDAPCEARAGSRLNSDKLIVRLTAKLLTHEWRNQPSKV